MKKLFNSRIICFIVGAIIFSGVSVFAYSMNSTEISYTPENSNFNVGTVKEALDELYSYASTVEFHSISSAFDGTPATINYTAEKNTKALVTGIGESTNHQGTTNFVLNTDGVSQVLVSNKCLYPAPTAYSCIYAYVVDLKVGQSLEAYTYSNQGHTSNTTVLYLLN